MGKTLNKLVYSIVEAVSNFEITDDSPFSIPWVEDQVITQNHTLIRKAHTEKRIDSYLYMTDENLSVKPLDKVSGIPGVTPTNCYEFSYADIKTPLTGLKGMEIEFVTSVNYSTIFKRVTINELLRGSSGYYSLNKPSYSTFDDMLIFKTSELIGMKYVSMSAIYNDPRTVSSWDADAIFKTPSEKNLEILTIQHIGTALGMPMDLINDAQRAYSQGKQTKNE